MQSFLDGLIGVLIIVGIIYLFFRKKKPKGKTNTAKDLRHTQGNPNEYYNSDLSREEYWYWTRHPIIRQHYDNIEKIKMMYTVAVNLTSLFSPEMEQCIALCIADINIASSFRDIDMKTNSSYEKLSYYSFGRLAIIYEKRGELDKAIDVCRRSMEVGYIYDGSDGGIPGRLARLINKQRKKNEQLSSGIE